MTCSFVKDHQYLGLEFDWIAIDREGRVGYFSTAGAGPIPSTVAGHEISYERLYELVMDLPVRGDVEQIVQTEWDVHEWLEVSRRGLYAFDWQHESNRYEVIAHPATPVRIEDLTGSVVGQLASLVRCDVQFSSASALIPSAAGMTTQ